MSTPTTKFIIGDQVKFMHVSESGSSVNFATREGKIVEFSKPKGLKACVRMRNGRKVWKRVSDLRGIKDKSPVNDVFAALTNPQR